uniref:glucan 1,3-beta-glucosidase n=1 Tax=Arcella intermedia TaxID=1963864 RepID=A0A6B2L8G9_9EUKA
MVLESWMTPTLFNQNGVPGGSGEWQFTQQLGKSRSQQVLQAHWDSWVSFGELQKLAQHGITHLRVPVGYWIVSIEPGEPFVYGGMDYLKRLLGWAQSLNLKVLIDLHGAPGSQNGHDNSGKTGPIEWQQPQNVARSISVIANITKQLLGYPAVTGVELLNEPWTTSIGGPIQFSTLKDYYTRAYAAVRATGFTGDIVIPDGWDNNQWNGFMSPPDYYNVYLDTHLYHCFGGDRDKSAPYANIDYTCQQDKPMLAGLTQRDWTIVGEWSNAVSQPPSGGDYNSFMGSFTRAQWSAYGASGTEAGAGPAKGGYFWSMKIENGDASWCYLCGIDAGVMPGDFSFEFCQ